jgi:hypothetical protein
MKNWKTGKSLLFAKKLHNLQNIAYKCHYHSNFVFFAYSYPCIIHKGVSIEYKGSKVYLVSIIMNRLVRLVIIVIYLILIIIIFFQVINHKMH